MNNFETAVRHLIQGLSNEQRWKKQRPHVTYENVLGHTIKQTTIVMMMVEAERLAGNPHQLDFYRLAQCAFTHDWGESISGDVSRDDKTTADEEREDAAYRQVLDKLLLPHLVPGFPPPLDRDPSAPAAMQEFWEMAEFIGYVLFSAIEAEITTYPDDARAKWRGIVEHYRTPLTEAAQKFAGVRLFTESLYSQK